MQRSYHAQLTFSRDWVITWLAGYGAFVFSFGPQVMLPYKWRTSDRSRRPPRPMLTPRATLKNTGQNRTDTLAHREVDVNTVVRLSFGCAFEGYGGANLQLLC
eukprot:2385690-Amphidinium_carterae.1